MKKVLLILGICMCLLPSMDAQVVAVETAEKTLDELKEEIEEWLENVPEYLKYFDFSTRIEADDPNEAVGEPGSVQEYDIATPLVLPSKEAVLEKVNDCYAGQLFYQAITDTASTITMYDTNCNAYLLENSRNLNQIVAKHAVIQKLFYRNGKVEKVDYPINCTLPSRLFVDSMLVQTDLRYLTNLKTITLSAQKPIAKEGKHTFQLTKNNKHKLLFQIEGSDDIQVYGVHGRTSDGVLVYASNEIIFDKGKQQQKELFLEGVEFVKKTLTKIENNEFNTTEEVEQYIEKEEPRKMVRPVQDVMPAYYYEFDYSVEAIDIYFADAFAEQTVTAVISQIGTDYAYDYFVASKTDEANEHIKYGFVDKNGNWLIEPTYARLRHVTDQFFTGSMSLEEESHLLIFDSNKEKMIEKKGYENIYKLAPDRYHIVISEKLAVINGQGDVVFQPSADGIYDISYLEDAHIFLAKDRTGQHIYDYDGKLRFPEKYQNADLSNGDFLTLTPLPKKEVYNAQNKKISDGTWVEAIPCFKGTHLLYVKNIQGEEFFVNTKGEVVIKPNPAYWLEVYNNEREIFKNSLHVVRSKDQYAYGCINTTGAIVVPLEYNLIYTFGEKYVCANKGNETFFIDRKGQVKKKIAASLSSYDFEGHDYSKIVYILDNGDVYDTEGNFLRKDPNFERE